VGRDNFPRPIQVQVTEPAIVLCVDEKSQIQALDRTQPLLPMRPGQVERRTHDFPRQTDDLRDLVIADLTRRARTGLVQKALHPTLREAPPPLADGVGRCADPRADVLIFHPFRRQQNDPRPLGQTLRCPTPRRQTSQFAPLPVAQIDPNRSFESNPASDFSSCFRSHCSQKTEI
jgi:hypothetical protein